MPVTVYQPEKAAILIAHFTGEVDAETLRRMYELSAELIVKNELSAPIYRITDFRHITASSDQILSVLKAAMQTERGGTLDPRIKPILLGDNRWSRLAQDIIKMPGYGNLEMPIFDGIGAAMAYARAQIRLRRGVS